MDKVVFIGSKSLGIKCLKEMHRLKPDSIMAAITFDDSADIRSNFEDFKSYCETSKIVLHIAKNSRETEKIISSLKPDWCFVIGWYWLFSESVLKLVKYNFIGLHNSLLPKYRGFSPLVWSIINGEKEIGFTLFSFTQGMDDGDVWFQKKIKLKPQHYVGEMLALIEDEAVKGIRTNYLKILSHQIKPEKQDNSLVTYCALRTPEHGKINWNKSATEVFNFIRAQTSPYPGAFSFYNNQKIVINKASVLDVVYYGTPGQVASVSSKGVIVICGNNTALNINEVVNGDGTITKAELIVNSIKIFFTDLN